MADGGNAQPIQMNGKQ